MMTGSQAERELLAGVLANVSDDEANGHTDQDR